jgi:hypothetical protein
MNSPRTQCSFTLPNDRENVWVKKHNKLANLEQLLEKLDSFLVLKNPKYDDFYKKIVVIQAQVLALREVFVKKLYTDKDKVLWQKSTEEIKDFLDEAFLYWPETRVTQRHHLCFYLGKDLLEEAVHPDKRHQWPMTHFMMSKYKWVEPKEVHDFKEEPNFKTSKTNERILFRELNFFLTELYHSLDQVFNDDFYRDECFDVVCQNAHELLIDILKLRQKCIEKYIGGEDAYNLNLFYSGRIEILTELKFDDFRKTQRWLL